MKFLIYGLVVLAATVYGNPEEKSQDLKFLLNGVHEIAAPGQPGALSVYGDAFTIVAGKINDIIAPAIAASSYGSGRIVVFGHTDYLSQDEKHTPTEADMVKFLNNAIHWAARSLSLNDNVTLAVYKRPNFVKFLKEHSINCEELSHIGGMNELKNYKVLSTLSDSLDESDIKPLIDYLYNGGGILIATTGWGWKMLHNNLSLSDDNLGNKISSAAGIVANENYLLRTSENGFSTELTSNLTITNANEALELLLNNNLTKAETPIAYKAILTANWVPSNDKLIRPKFLNLTTRTDIHYPSHEKTLNSSEYVDRLSIFLQTIDASRLPAEKVTVNPASRYFPGIVDNSIKRISKSLEINTTIYGWHSTGLYAPPGEVITVTSSGLSSRNLYVKIGCHTDVLWGKDSWRRVPEITINRKIASDTTTIASAFGGLIYIQVPGKVTLGKITINITGGVESPWFVLGKTTKDEWQNVEKHHLGPWSEIGSSKLIITVPTTAISKLDDPEPLMQFWDKVLDSYSDLLGISYERLKPERIVPDEQISSGYMHSGYPIMTFLDVVDHSINLQKLLKNDTKTWGYFHELGHNHQKEEWTFKGTGEVTNNILALYAMETVCGISGEEARHYLQKADIKQRYKKYNDSGLQFDTWKSDSDLALISYYQLKLGFGWDPYKKIFREYSLLSESEKPKNDDDKRDQWMVRFSKIVGKNLGHFYQEWGVPTSKKAQESISNLPNWMPDGFPYI